jgi:hypothetical protein
LTYPSADTNKELGSLLKEANPDAIVVVHSEALAAIRGLNISPCLGIMGDPAHFPAYYSWRHVLSPNIRFFIKKRFP